MSPVTGVPFLEMRNISRTFPGVKALDRVNLEIRAGEVLALAGENGARQKHADEDTHRYLRARPAGGTILIEGQEVTLADSHHARALGVNIIYQELAVVGNLTVGENIFLAREPRTRLGLIDRLRMYREARAKCWPPSTWISIPLTRAAN